MKNPLPAAPAGGSFDMSETSPYGASVTTTSTTTGTTNRCFTIRFAVDSVRPDYSQITAGLARQHALLKIPTVALTRLARLDDAIAQYLQAR